jgi:hypothetical protein
MVARDHLPDVEVAAVVEAIIRCKAMIISRCST